MAKHCTKYPLVNCLLEAYARLTCRSEGSPLGEGSGAVGITVTREQREDVERQLRRTDLTRRRRERLEMVKAAALGDDVERSARWSGRSQARVERWLARFAADGVAALSDASRSGRPVRADEGYLPLSLTLF